MIKNSLILSAFLANATTLKTLSANRLNSKALASCEPDCPCDEVPISGHHACQCFTVGCVDTVCAQAECKEADEGDRPGDFEGDCCERCFLNNGKFINLWENVVPPTVEDLKGTLEAYFAEYMNVNGIALDGDTITV